MAQRLAACRGEVRVACEDELRVLASGFEQGAMHLYARDTEARHAGLARAEDLAFAAEPQILLGDPETIFSLAQNLNACLGGLPERGAIEQQASRALAPPPDAPAQL